MNYSDNEGSVRVDVFKPSGKWYETVAVDMYTFYHSETTIHQALLAAIERQYPGFTAREPGWKFVCLQPYHRFSHPIMLICKDDGNWL